LTRTFVAASLAGPAKAPIGGRSQVNIPRITNAHQSRRPARAEAATTAATTLADPAIFALVIAPASGVDGIDPIPIVSCPGSGGYRFLATACRVNGLSSQPIH
jgi:hypothetical protein